MYRGAGFNGVHPTRDFGRIPFNLTTKSANAGFNGVNNHL